MGKVANGILMVTTIYVAYKIGKHDGKEEANEMWMSTKFGVSFLNQFKEIIKDLQSEMKEEEEV